MPATAGDGREMQSEIYYDEGSAIHPDTDREVEKVSEYLEGLPKLSIGALFLPPIWGCAQGIWATILWYPLWVLADNVFFAWYSLHSVLATVIGVVVLVGLTAGTVLFARVSAPYAALRALRKGKTKEQFQRSERIWAVASVVAGVAMIAFATYYNLCVRAPLGM